MWKSFLERGTLVTDFSAATEYISWKAVHEFADALILLSQANSELTDNHNIFGCAGSFLKWSASEFWIDYDNNQTVEGKACGLLMGSPLTKECLHLFSEICSRADYSDLKGGNKGTMEITDVEAINECRLLLGDDILMLLDHEDWNGFYTKIALFGLQSNKEKTNSGVFVKITDRVIAMTKTRNEDGKDIFEYQYSDLMPLKILTTDVKHISGEDKQYSIKSGQFILGTRIGHSDKLLMPLTTKLFRRYEMRGGNPDICAKAQSLEGISTLSGGMKQLKFKDDIKSICDSCAKSIAIILTKLSDVRLEIICTTHSRQTNQIMSNKGYVLLNSLDGITGHKDHASKVNVFNKESLNSIYSDAARYMIHGIERATNNKDKAIRGFTKFWIPASLLEIALNRKAPTIVDRIPNMNSQSGDRLIMYKVLDNELGSLLYYDPDALLRLNKDAPVSYRVFVSKHRGYQ